jgi:hypothetical protein
MCLDINPSLTAICLLFPVPPLSLVSSMTNVEYKVRRLLKV